MNTFNAHDTENGIKIDYFFREFSEPTEAFSLVIKQRRSEAVINKVVSIQNIPIKNPVLRLKHIVNLT